MITEKDFKTLLRMNKVLLEKVEKLEKLISGDERFSEPEKFLTKKQASAYLQITERQINYMLAENKLPFATKVGGRWRFPKSALERYVARM